MEEQTFATAFQEELSSGLDSLHLEVARKHLPTLVRYALLVVEWNHRAGLTSIVDPVEMARKHFLDSLLCLKSPGWAEGTAVVDVGSGAGFPGLALSIVVPDRQFTLLEATGKKCAFLEYAASTLGANAKVLQCRAEEYGRHPDGAGRERFDVGLARAVAPLGIACELVLPLITVGGSLIAQVGPGQGQALRRYESGLGEGGPRPAWTVLGAEVTSLQRTELPGDAGERWSASFRKTSAGAKGYPRRPAATKREPLWVPEG